MHGSPGSFRCRVVLLGASNLTLSLPTVIDRAERALGGPLEVFAAAGLGRCYGRASHFLVRELPSIETCGLWEALRRAPERPTFALATDLGNDLPAGALPAETIAALRRCLERLDGARVVVTGLPLPLLRALPAWKFALWRRLWYPFRGVSREALLARAEELDARLRELSAGGAFERVEPDPAWYGADPIHVRLSARASAWSFVLQGWGAGAARSAAQGGLARAALRASLGAESARLFGLERRRPQPCVRSESGGALSLF